MGSFNIETEEARLRRKVCIQLSADISGKSLTTTKFFYKTQMIL